MAAEQLYPGNSYEVNTGDQPRKHLVLEVNPAESDDVNQEWAQDVQAFFQLVNLTSDWAEVYTKYPLPTQLPPDEPKRDLILQRVSTISQDVKSFVKLHEIMRGILRISEAEKHGLSERLIYDITGIYSDVSYDDGESERAMMMRKLTDASSDPEQTKALLQEVRRNSLGYFHTQTGLVSRYAQSHVPMLPIRASKHMIQTTMDMVSGVAHDLKNPITPILGRSQMIGRDPEARYEKGAAVIHEGFQKLRSLCTGINSLMENVNPREEILLAGVRRIFEDGIIENRTRLAEEGISIRILPEEEAVMYSAVNCSRDIFHRLVTNVIENVLKSYKVRDTSGDDREDPKTLDIRFKADSWGVEIAFEDFGMGMPDSILAEGSFIRGHTEWEAEQQILKQIPGVEQTAILPVHNPYDDSKKIEGTGYGMAKLAEMVVGYDGVLIPRPRKDGKTGARIELHLPL